MTFSSHYSREVCSYNTWYLRKGGMFLKDRSKGGVYWMMQKCHHSAKDRILLRAKVRFKPKLESYVRHHTKGATMPFTLRVSYRTPYPDRLTDQGTCHFKALINDLGLYFERYQGIARAKKASRLDHNAVHLERLMPVAEP